MTKQITALKLPALLIISFILSAYAFTAEEESVIRNGRSSAISDASKGHVHQVYLDPHAENDVSQHLPTATLTIEVDERSYLRTSSGEQRRSLSFWSSIMNAIHCGLGHHDHCHHHHDSGGGSSTNSSNSTDSGNGNNSSSKSGNNNKNNANGYYNNGNGYYTTSSGNGNNDNANGYYNNGNGYYITSNSNGSSSQYDVYVVTVTENENGETYYIDENGDTVVEDYVETCTDAGGEEYYCITVTTTTEGTQQSNNDNSNDDPCWADPSSCNGKSGGDGVFSAFSVSDNPLINEIVFGAGFIGVATVAGLLYKKRYYQTTNSQMQEHMLNGAVGKRRRTFAEVFSKDLKPSSGEQEMSTITRYVQA